MLALIYTTRRDYSINSHYQDESYEEVSRRGGAESELCMLMSVGIENEKGSQ